jgi:hypothetical protein
MTDHTQMVECPDCTAVEKSNHLLHEATCPLGLAMDRVSAADAEWFERHPSTNSTDDQSTQPKLRKCASAACCLQSARCGDASSCGSSHQVCGHGRSMG